MTNTSNIINQPLLTPTLQCTQTQLTSSVQFVSKLPTT